MKTCLLCNTVAPDSAVTCARDGEASWSKPTRGAAPKAVVTPAARPNPPAQPAVDVPDPSSDAPEDDTTSPNLKPKTRRGAR